MPLVTYRSSYNGCLMIICTWTKHVFLHFGGCSSRCSSELSGFAQGHSCGGCTPTCAWPGWPVNHLPRPSCEDCSCSQWSPTIAWRKRGWGVPGDLKGSTAGPMEKMRLWQVCWASALVILVGVTTSLSIVYTHQAGHLGSPLSQRCCGGSSWPHLASARCPLPSVPGRHSADRASSLGLFRNASIEVGFPWVFQHGGFMFQVQFC